MSDVVLENEVWVRLRDCHVVSGVTLAGLEMEAVVPRSRHDRVTHDDGASALRGCDTAYRIRLYDWIFIQGRHNVHL